MHKKPIILIIFTIILISGGLLLYFNLYKLKCDEQKVILDGKFDVIRDKYTIDVFKTSDKTYWIYGYGANSPDTDITAKGSAGNRTVRIQAILSPALTKNNPSECNVCYRTCPTCQCPMAELLYDVKIIKILE
jgi:hypothetical protein